MASATETRNNLNACCSLTAKRHTVGPSLSLAVVGGLTGTAALTAMMYLVAPMMGLNMDIAQMLGSMLGGSWVAGMAMHFMLGTLVFPLVFALIVFRFLPGGPVLKGLSLGVALWLMAQIVVMPMMGAGLFSANSGGMMAAAGSLVGHLLYGGVLGVFASASK